jgi:hypothetical protein
MESLEAPSQVDSIRSESLHGSLEKDEQQFTTMDRVLRMGESSVDAAGIRREHMPVPGSVFNGAYANPGLVQLRTQTKTVQHFRAVWEHVYPYPQRFWIGYGLEDVDLVTLPVEAESGSQSTDPSANDDHCHFSRRDA